MLVAVRGRCCILLLYQRNTRLDRRRGQVRATDPPTFRFQAVRIPRCHANVRVSPVPSTGDACRWLLLLSPLLSAAVRTTPSRSLSRVCAVSGPPFPPGHCVM
jgi:hypothetical protein